MGPLGVAVPALASKDCHLGIEISDSGCERRDEIFEGGDRREDRFDDVFGALHAGEPPGELVRNGLPSTELLASRHGNPPVAL